MSAKFLLPRLSWTIPVLASLLFLTACGASATSSTEAYNAALKPALRLALGTLDLEDTDQAVSTTAAERLLPLWELLDELESSGAAASAEITAVVAEIESEMAASQLDAIRAMNLTDQDVAQVSGGHRQAASSTQSAVGSFAAAAGIDPRLSGAMPDGAGGGSMAAPPAQQSGSASQVSAAASAPSLIKQVVQLLQSKLQD